MNYRNKSCQIVTFDVETFANHPTDEQIGAVRAAAELEAKEELVQEKAITSRIDKAVKKYIDGGALDFERAQIISIAMISDFDGEMHSKSHADEKEIAHWFCEEVAMLLQEHNLEIRFAGFNITAFDLPMICHMLARHELPPPFRITKWAPIDLAYEPYGKCIGKKPLDWYLRCYGIPVKTNHGSEVHEMWKRDLENNTNEVERYNRADALKEYTLLQKIGNFYEF